MTHSSHEKNRPRRVMTLAAILWISAFFALFIGFRLKSRPILLVGGVDALLAMFMTSMAFMNRDKK